MEPLNVLTPAEVSRAAAIPGPSRRAEFLMGSLLGREVVQEATGVDRDQVSIERTCTRCGGPHGRPTVKSKASSSRHLSEFHTVDLSISHSAGWVVAACVRQGRVGVDIEDRSTALDIESVAAWLLHPSELQLAGSQDRDALLRAWVQKEAVLKASGEGIRLPMSGLCLGEGELQSWDEHPEYVSQIELQVLETPPGLLGAAALIASG